MVLSYCILVVSSTVTALLFLPPFLAERTVNRKPSVARRLLNGSAYRILTFNHRYALISGGILITAAITGLSVLPRTILQPPDDAVVYGQLECRQGAGIGHVDRELVRVFKEISGFNGIDKVETLARRSRGTFSIHFIPELITRKKVEEMLNAMNTRLSESYIHISSANSRFFSIRLDFLGPDTSYLKHAARETAGFFQTFPWVHKAVLHFTKGDPVLVFEPDRKKTAAAHVPLPWAAESLRWILFGPVVGKWHFSGREYDIRRYGTE